MQQYLCDWAGDRVCSY